MSKKTYKMNSEKRGEKMIDTICEFLTNRIRKQMPEIDDERAEVINYGLQNLVRRTTENFHPIWSSSIITDYRFNIHCIFSSFRISCFFRRISR